MTFDRISCLKKRCVFQRHSSKYRAGLTLRHSFTERITSCLKDNKHNLVKKGLHLAKLIAAYIANIDVNRNIFPISFSYFYFIINFLFVLSKIDFVHWKIYFLSSIEYNINIFLARISLDSCQLLIV